MFGPKPGAGAARGAAPAPSATRTAARRWRALIGVALVAGLLAGGCAGPTPAPPPSPTPGTAPTVVVEPSPTPTPAIVVEPSPTPLPAPRYERADGAIVVRDAAGNPVSAVAEDVREKIDREAGLIAGSGRASGLGLSCHVSASGELMWAVTDGDEDLPAGSLLELVEREGETEIRYHTLAGATHDLNQFEGIDEAPYDWKVRPTELLLDEDTEGNTVVKAIIRKKDPRTKKETIEVVGEVNTETGDWERSNKVAYTKTKNEDKTETGIVWIWTPRSETEGGMIESPSMRPYMALTGNEKFYVDDHGGVKDIEVSEDGQTVLVLRDDSKVRVVEDENTRRLEFPSAEERVREWLDRLPANTWIAKDENGTPIDKKWIEENSWILVKYLEYCQDENFQDTCIPQNVRDLVKQRLGENGNPKWAKDWLTFSDGFLKVKKIGGGSRTESYPYEIGNISLLYDTSVKLGDKTKKRAIRLLIGIVKEGAFVDLFAETLQTRIPGYYQDFENMSQEEIQAMNDIFSTPGTMLIGEALTTPYIISFSNFIKDNVELFSDTDSGQKDIIEDVEYIIDYTKQVLGSSDELRRINPYYP